MSKRFKPIVLKNKKHDAIPADEKIAGVVFDVAQIISQDDGNALSYDHGLFYSRCACPEYRYFVIETAPFPYFAKEQIHSAVTLMGLATESVVKEQSARESVSIQMEPVSGSNQTVTGYLNAHRIQENTAIHLSPLASSQKTVTGYQQQHTQEQAYMHLEPASASNKTMVGIVQRKDSIRSQFNLTGVETHS